MTKEKKNIIAVAFRLLVIIASIALASYAWLNRNQKVSTEDLILRTNSYSNLLISLDEGENWSDELSLDFTNDYSFDYEITGDGINFYKAASKRDDGTPVTFKKAAANKDYLEFDIWFKASGNVGVFLENESYIIPTAGSSEDKLLGSEVARVSSMGDFSRDLIASSVRVAFIDNIKNNNLYVPNSYASLVWAPNKNYEIECVKDRCSANLNSQNKQSYEYIDASESSVYKPKNIGNLKDELKASNKIQSAAGDPMLTYLDSKIDNGIKKVTVRIWIEGNDRDNVSALIGGMFSINLSFTAFSKQINNNIPKVSALNNTINGFDKTMEYSKDLGLSWITYENDNNPSFETGDVVYVRESETYSTFASKYKILTF